MDQGYFGVQNILFYLSKKCNVANTYAVFPECSVRNQDIAILRSCFCPCCFCRPFCSLSIWRVSVDLPPSGGVSEQPEEIKDNCDHKKYKNLPSSLVIKDMQPIEQECSKADHPLGRKRGKHKMCNCRKKHNDFMHFFIFFTSKNCGLYMSESSVREKKIPSRISVILNNDLSTSITPCNATPRRSIF